MLLRNTILDITGSVPSAPPLKAPSSAAGGGAAAQQSDGTQEGGDNGPGNSGCPPRTSRVLFVRFGPVPNVHALATVRDLMTILRACRI